MTLPLVTASLSPGLLSLLEDMTSSVGGEHFSEDRGSGRRQSPRSVLAYPLIPRSCAAVPPRILIRSSSLSPGIAMTWSTGAVFHGNG
jgi:hypothetical protein